jgi:hypothetical protein
MGKKNQSDIMARRGNASLRAAKSAGAPSYVGKNVRARAGKVIAGAGRLPNGIAACHRVSDKRFRTISKLTLDKLGDSSLPVAKRNQILASFTGLTNAMGGPKFKRKVQLERRKKFVTMLTTRPIISFWGIPVITHRLANVRMHVCCRQPKKVASARPARCRSGLLNTPGTH